jgi:predicted nucleic acid-binding protein
MKHVFADAQYWVALINNQDQSHAAAKAASIALHGAVIITTEEVLTEVLAFFSERGRFLRQFAAATIRSIYANQTMRVVPQSSQSFAAGLDLYEARPDKGYSLTDCISMVTMRQEGITDVLSHDGHFTQEGFAILL